MGEKRQYWKRWLPILVGEVFRAPGTWEDLKTWRKILASGAALTLLHVNRLRELIVDADTVLRLAGTVVPVTTTGFVAFKVLQGAVRRTNERMAEELGVVAEPPALPPPPPTDVDEFRKLEGEMIVVLDYLLRDDQAPYSADLEGRMWALKDNLQRLDLLLPDREQGGKLLGLMKTGNLAKARRQFPDLPF